NTGNLMRLSANTGVRLHLVEPLGFTLDERRLRRAGLDYREWARVDVHESLEVCLAVVEPHRLLAYSGGGRLRYTDVVYRDDDALVFGPESVGLPDEVLDQADEVLRIPMLPNRRSLNLANAVSIVVYEAWRQGGFAGSV
ncbi:MAG TPA: tRNA (cytidine(34)-2'-O)-methyltransferase, partial [Actinobacteria bacterium]|nr:tRNA (cytidine(34)-2'-O)-methyltransferase [Actinomycetota bacterium]